MVKVIHVDDSGAEVAAVELDDFTVEIVYAGIADLLRAAAVNVSDSTSSPVELTRDGRARRERILKRLQEAGSSPLR